MNTDSQEAARNAAMPDVAPTFSLATILQFTAGSMESAQRIIGLIVDEIPPLLSNLELGHEGADRETLERAAHTLKTHASYVGAEAFREQAERTELLCRTDNTEELPAQVARLATLGHATLNALNSIDWEQLSRDGHLQHE